MEVYQWLAIIDFGIFAILTVELLVWWLCTYRKFDKLRGAIGIIAVNVLLDVAAAVSGLGDAWLIWLTSATTSSLFIFGMWQPHGIRGMLADRRSRNEAKQEKD
jgi:uncharacterized membrane protein